MPGWAQKKRKAFDKMVGKLMGTGSADADATGAAGADATGAADGGAKKNPTSGAGGGRESMSAAMMNVVKMRVEAEVKDQATAKLLVPEYPFFCKRPCFHDTYLRLVVSIHHTPRSREHTYTIHLGHVSIHTPYTSVT
jgi:hypothetical protein